MTAAAPIREVSSNATVPAPRRLEHEHTREAIRKRLEAGPDRSYLRDFVYGGVDGIVTTFAIVSGVVGARLAPQIILILGTASLVADGFAMAAADYLATRSEDEKFHHAEAVERRHIIKSAPRANAKRFAKSSANTESPGTCWTRPSLRLPQSETTGFES